MKLKNILAMISFLVVAVSCSMGDDVLNEIEKDEAQNNGKQTEVGLSLNVNVNAISTKAYTDGEIGEEISAGVTTCSVILFQGNKILGVYDEVEVENGVLTGANFLVKTGIEYLVYVIGDTKKGFKACADKAAVDALLFNKEDLNSYVKFGKKEFTSTVTGSSAVGSAQKETITINLDNLTAQIRLMDVLYAGFTGSTTSKAVKLTKVELINQNLQYNIAGNANMMYPVTNPVKALNYEVLKKEGDVTYDEDPLCGFQTFPNTDASKPVQLQLTFQVGIKTETRTYVINRPTLSGDMENNAVDDNEGVGTYVNPGFIYQLYATVVVTGDTFDCTLKCYTRDWLYNEVEVELIESN